MRSIRYGVVRTQGRIMQYVIPFLSIAVIVAGEAMALLAAATLFAGALVVARAEQTNRSA